MAVQILGKFGQNFGQTLGQSVSNFTAAQSLKKNLEEKRQEKTKVYGYIGMEVYDLYKASRIQIPEAEVHFERLAELEREIAELEAQLAKAEEQTKGIQCACGRTVKRNMSFCPYCGRPVGGAENAAAQAQAPKESAPAAEQQYVECICGAKVPVGQSICMECGRRIEK